MKQTDVLLNKLMHSAGVPTKKALASELGITETAFYKAYNKQSDYLLGRILKFSVKKEIDLNWLFSHSPSTDTLSQEPKAQ